MEMESSEAGIITCVSLPARDLTEKTSPEAATTTFEPQETSSFSPSSAPVLPPADYTAQKHDQTVSHDHPLSSVSSPIRSGEAEPTSIFESQAFPPRRFSSTAPELGAEPQREASSESAHVYPEELAQAVEPDPEDQGDGDLSFSPAHSRQASRSRAESNSFSRQLHVSEIPSTLASIREAGLGERPKNRFHDLRRQGQQSSADNSKLKDAFSEDAGDMGAQGYDDSEGEEQGQQSEPNDREEADDAANIEEAPVRPDIVVHQASPSRSSSSASRISYPEISREPTDEQKEEEDPPADADSGEQLSAAPAQIDHQTASNSTHQTDSTYTRPAKVSHGRIDSLPPQKYEIPPALPLKVSPYSLARDISLVEEEAIEQPVYDYGRTRTLSGKILSSELSNSRSRSRTSSSNSSSAPPDLNRSHAPSARFRSHSNSSDSTDGSLTGEAEKAGLDFEDLDLEVDPNFLSHQVSPSRRSTSPAPTVRSVSPSTSSKRNSPYGSNAASFSRSSVEIRSDSIASGSKAAKQITKAAKQRSEAEEKKKIEKELRDGWRLRRLGAHSANGDYTEDDDADDRRSVEGRYRGRTSRGNSRANSPEPPSSPAQNLDHRSETLTQDASDAEHSRKSQFARGWAPAEDQKKREREEEMRKEAEEEVRRTGVGMMVAGEDGELKVVGAGSEVDSSQVVERTEEEKHDSARDSSTTNRSELSAKGGNSARASESNQSHSAFPSETSLSKSQQTTSTPVPTSLILTDAADKPKTKHSRKLSKGPSALEQHISKTRMAHLPPKARLEESKHLNSFESMMKQSKILEQKRQEEEALARIERENELNERTRRWEKEILPNWNRSRRDESLKSLWKLGCPPNLRGRVWTMASGNAQMLPRGLLTQARGVKEEKRKELRDEAQDGNLELDLEPICKDDRDAIEEDIARTLPTLKLFQKDIGPLYDDLKDVLEGLVMVRYDQLFSSTSSTVKTSPFPGSLEQGTDIGNIQIPVYQMGFAALSATLLCNLSPQETLIALINLIEERPWLKSVYSLNHAIKQKSEAQTWLEANVEGKSKSGSISKTFSLFSSSSSKSDSSQVHGIPRRTSLHALASEAIAATRASRQASFLKSTKGYERVFSTLLADRMPKVYANLGHNNVDIGDYVRSWVSELFTRVVSLDCASRIWDQVLLDPSDTFLFRVALALVHCLESRLWVPDSRELRSILAGNNSAALSVWRRSQGLSNNSRQGVGETRVVEGVHEATAADNKTDGQVASGENQARDDADAPEETKGGANTTNINGTSAPSTPLKILTPEVTNGDPSTPTKTPTSASFASSIEAPPEFVPKDNLFAQYGVTEDLLFRTLEEQEMWWKDSTLDRLLNRELE